MRNYIKADLLGGKSKMRKIEDIQFDRKRDKIIDTLVDNGIFKVNGKQLYELTLYELMKQYMKKVND